MAANISGMELKNRNKYCDNNDKDRLRGNLPLKWFILHCKGTTFKLITLQLIDLSINYV